MMRIPKGKETKAEAGNGNDWDKEQMGENGWDIHDIVGAICGVALLGMFVLLYMEVI